MDEAEAERIAEGLGELERKILAHIYAYGPDTPWLMARRLLGAAGWAPVVPEDEVEAACRRLEELGLLERYRGSLKGRVTSSIKPWLKVKQRNPERKGSGIYYSLTKKGRWVAGYIYKRYFRTRSS
ncbi:MAG: hypothetical protein ACP5KY_01375 [Thermoproteus sp.]